MDWVKQATKHAKDLVHGQSSRSEPGGTTQAHQERHSGEPSAQQPMTAPVRVDRITTQVRLLRPQRSNFPHIYRDGGGGGTVGGQHLIIFADGSYTRGPPPTDESQLVNFISNSIAVIGPSGHPETTIERVTDFGTPEKGPFEAIPFHLDQGESPFSHGVWPDQNICPLPDGASGVAFPSVIDRNAFREGREALLYNTAIEVGLQHHHGDRGPRPIATRPVKSLFLAHEPAFGSFTVYPAGDDTGGYLYLFARVSEADKPDSNGLKLARVRPQGWADRTQYEFWDGQQFGPRVPPPADGGSANVFHYSQEAFGKHYGPGSGDIFWSPVYKEYILVFQNAAAALDNSVYLSHSPSLTGGWSKAECIYKLPRASDGYSYAFHAYPNMDPTGRAVPITWTQDSKAKSYVIGTGEILFS